MVILPSYKNLAHITQEEEKCRGNKDENLPPDFIGLA
jgi:hypothetical protein